MYTPAALLDGAIKKLTDEKGELIVSTFFVDLEALAIDGNRFRKYHDLPHTTVVKGDGKLMSIAAASVLAKTYRDDYMLQLHEQYPRYGWDRNKGYPTKEHRQAIEQHGTTPYHRLTFNLLGDGQLSLPF